MFSITIEETFQISTRKGVVLIGKTSGLVKIGDYLVDANDRSSQYKVIGTEMVHYINTEKNITHNPAIMIEQGNYEPLVLKGKILMKSINGGI